MRYCKKQVSLKVKWKRLNHFSRHTTVEQKESMNRHRVNTLTTEGRILIALAFGFFFAGILLVLVTELRGPLPTIQRMVFFVSLMTIGAIITDIVRKVMYKRGIYF